jgi:hypothetical protein
MKKLLTICLIMATMFTVNAQEKPSREVTAKFIDATLKKTIGTEDLPGGNLLTNVSFDGNQLILTTTRKNLELRSTTTYSNFDWEGLSIFLVRNDQEKSKITGFEVVQISFETNFKEVYIAEQFGKVRNTERLKSWILIHMPSDKIASLEKAFLRLSEIAKEENKDPFQN